MVHIDTLQAYENLVASGIPEKEAKAQVHELNAAFDGVATKEDLTHGLKDLGKDLKIFFGYIILSFIALEIIWPLAAKKWGL